MRYLQITLLFLLFPTGFLSAQYYETGQDPASVKWLQIKTERFRIIYPESYGKEGVLFAKSLDESYSKLNGLFPERKFRIPVIIHSYSTESNGYVAWAPKRMEIYPAPDQNSIPLGTRTQLTIHELTHVFQMASLSNGFSKFMSYLLGEQFTGITSAMLPLWYFEGNAVFTESLLTPSGRGRTPSFLQDFKAITLENKQNFKYDMVVNGSYRKYVPNHYHSGYQIVTYSLAKNGRDFWNHNLDYTARFPFLADPVNLSMLRQANTTKRKLYEETFDTLKLLWNKELAEKKLSEYPSFNAPKKSEFINYYSPVITGRDSILSIKTSLSDPACFVITDPGDRSERRIFTPGQMYPYCLSYGGGKIVWVEFEPDPRWENRNYQIIKLLDLKTGSVRTLAHKTRYLAASVSPDGSKIAASENTAGNRNSLVIIDVASGRIINKSDAPENASLQRPQWNNEGNTVTVISLTDRGEAILACSISGNSWKTLIEYGRNDIQSAVLRNDSLFFISSESGSNEIHLRTSDGFITCLSSSKYGLSDLAVNGNNLVFSNYTSQGFEVTLKDLNEFHGDIRHATDSSSFLINRFGKLDKTEDVSDISVYKPEPYKKYLHLFGFHSWMPLYADIEQVKSDPATIRPGFTLLAQNQLSTLFAETGYEFSENREHILHSKITWKGWYPVIESRIDYGGSPGILTGGVDVGSPADIRRGMRWVNSISLPLRYSSGKFARLIQPYISYDYRNNYIYSSDEKKYDYGQGFLSGRLFVSNYHRSSYRDIYPRWAQVFDLNYMFAPFNTAFYPDVLSLKTALYTPGIFPNNGLKLRFEREKQGEAKYSFNNRISFPRGYKNIMSKDLAFYSADYTFPVIYPDFNISSLFYLKRIRATLFGDYARGRDNLYLKDSGSGAVLDYRHQYPEVFSSFGIEALADFHILRLPFMISGGVQSAWKNINEKPSFEVLFNIELFGMAINRENKL
jgi:hypothetical protein